MSFAGPRVHHRLTDSTNDRARELALAGAVSGTAVTADEQSAGRGRHGRRWAAPAGSALLCSFVLRPVERHHSLLPLAVPIAVCEAVEALAPVTCRVKWPNDVWLDDRKLAGVLIEARPPDWAVIGVGLNLSIADDAFPDDLRWPATSVGHGATVPQGFAALRDALDRWLDADPAAVTAAFAKRDALRGRQVSWEGSGGEHASGSGTAAGIDERGNLQVEMGSGAIASLGAGEVSLRIE